ncbi:MAG: D-tyrosyl-tRNA(Tyr) deacylase [Methanomicrobiales archaeon]|nr:D-tyrosyl-tRNA(Tyr) deacylase [Methanomicrobiales archaeon]NYT21033.1 D-tyrosyl-tRNA(Tyr) deacylase [Methanomicrobiales archaeon]
MKIALVHSRQDPGGRTIRKHIDELLSGPGSGRNFPLCRHDLSFHETEGRLIAQDYLDRSLDAGLILFLSRHSSINPIPVLTVHVTGNTGPAALGGMPSSLAQAAPAWMQAVLIQLNAHAPPGYRVSYEVTHHGPSEIETPSLFVEIGSTEQEWADPRAGEAVARSILSADPGVTINLAGIGGTHYARRQTEIALGSRAAFGHIVHTRETDRIDREMLRMLVGKSSAEAVYIDRKALKPDELSRLDSLIAEAGIPRLTETEIFQMKHLSWKTWNRVRDLARSVDPGAAVHIPGAVRDGDPGIIKLPPDLVHEAYQADPAGLGEGLEQLPVIVLSTHRAPILPSFIVTGENSSVVLNDLISLCVTTISRGENAAIEGDQLVIRKTRFDPDRARSLGVPRGPLFGLLMKGTPVIVDGREITPDMVRICEEKHIRIPGLEKKR